MGETLKPELNLAIESVSEKSPSQQAQEGEMLRTDINQTTVWTLCASVIIAITIGVFFCSGIGIIISSLIGLGVGLFVGGLQDIIRTGIGGIEENKIEYLLAGFLTILGAMGTCASVGALVGSVIPGAGTIIGAVAGAILGLGIGLTFASTAFWLFVDESTFGAMTDLEPISLDLQDSSRLENNKPSAKAFFDLKTSQLPNTEPPSPALYSRSIL